MGETFLLTSGDKNELTAKIKGHFAAHEEELKKTHRIPSGGLTITRSHTIFVDSILSSLFKAISAEVSAGRDTALIALGGYGRGELNIRSDIDLMLLYKKGLTAEIEQLTQKMLYILWDAGLDVGFAIRKSGECIDLAREDSKTMTSFLDIRYLLGDNGLFTELEERVKKHLFTGKPLRNFIEEKLEEKKTRHEKYGGSVYILEPNVKEGEGGLRDIHTATWVVKAKNQGQFLPLETGLLTGAEIRSLEEAGDFLHWVRNDLHFETRRKKDQLTFEHQERIAGLRGFVDKGHELAVEAFMQEYYRRASGIKNTSDLIISRCLRKKDAVFTFIRKKSKIDENFSTLGGLLTVAGDDVFTKNPPSIMKAFEHSQSFSVDMDRRTKDLILKNLEVIDDAFRSSPQAGKSFMNILNGEKVYETLLEMHTLKVLERYIPEFSAITCKVQHDLYHVYTVDIHSLFAIRELERLKTSYRGEFALLSDLFSEVKNPEILMLAVLLHEAVRALSESRFLEERLRLFRVKGDRLHIQIVGPASGRKRSRDDGPLPVEKGIQHLLPVHRAGEGFSHAFVREKGVPHVVAEEGIGQRVVGLENEPLVSLDLGDVPGVHQHDHVDGVEHERLRHDILVRKGLGDEFVDMGPALEIVLIRHKDDLPVGGDIFENVRTGADGILDKGVLPREIQGIARSVTRDDLKAELGERVQNGPLEGEPHRIVIDLFRVVDERKHRLERRDCLGMHHDLVGEYDVVRRERLRLLTLFRVPGHVLFQGKGIGAAFCSYLPFVSQFGHDLLLFVDPDQPVENELGETQGYHLVARYRVQCGRTTVFSIIQSASVRPAVLLAARFGRL